MKIIALILIIFNLTFPTIAMSSDTDEAKAKAYYLAAEESYKEKKYTSALRGLEKVKELLGSSNAAISALETKIYYSKKDYKKAKSSLDFFLTQDAHPDLFKEMSAYTIKIDDAILKEKQAKKRRSEEKKRLAEEKKRKAEEQREKQRRIAEENKRKEAQLGIRFVKVSAGSFKMGSPKGETDETPVHTVRISAFLLGETEVTQAQWHEVMGSEPSKFKHCDQCPVEMVSWHDIQRFLNELNKITGLRYRLPTEAEWEYACRSEGKAQEYCGDDNTDSVAWYNTGKSAYKTHPVKGKRPNGLGLYDMSGNVWEWVQDCYHDAYRGAPVDGSAWISGDCEVRVQRGGSYFVPARFSRSSNRTAADATSRYGTIGFRLAKDL